MEASAGGLALTSSALKIEESGEGAGVIAINGPGDLGNFRITFSEKKPLCVASRRPSREGDPPPKPQRQDRDWRWRDPGRLGILQAVLWRLPRALGVSLHSWHCSCGRPHRNCVDRGRNIRSP